MANIVKVKAKTDIDNFILAVLNGLRVLPISFNDPTPILVDNYLDCYRKIATYLTTLRQSPEIDIKEFNAFKKKGMKFKVQDNHLFCQNSKNVLIHRVFDDPVERQTIFQQLHNQSRYEKQEGTY